MTIEPQEERTGLGWTFGSYVFQDAFAKLATAFRWMFWGMLLLFAGAALAGGPFAALFFAKARLDPKLVLPGIVAMAIGGIVLLIGEQKCLHIELPMGMTRSLPGHNWLRAAYWCHLGSWLLRMGRRFLDRGLVAAVLLPLQFAGFVFLLLFLRKTADVLARRDLKWLVDIIFLVASLTVLSGAFLAAEAFLKLQILRTFPRFLALAFLALPVVLFITATGAYVVLLGRMASAAAAFAKYLKEANDAEPAPDEDEGD